MKFVSNHCLFVIFFSQFCQTKEDSEEEEVEEVVYKDSSHFLKVFIFYMYLLPVYKMYNFPSPEKERGQKSRFCDNLQALLSLHKHIRQKLSFQSKSNIIFQNIIYLLVYFVFQQGTQSANPHNDYCQHFVDTGQRPHNFIRDVG